MYFQLMNILKATTICREHGVNAVTTFTKQPGAQLTEVAMHHRKPPLPLAKHRCALVAASTVPLYEKKECQSISVSHAHNAQAASTCASLLSCLNALHQ